MNNQEMPQPEVTTYTVAEVCEQTAFCGRVSVE